MYIFLLCVYYFSCRMLARSQYLEGPTTGHLGTDFSWFPYVYKPMLRWFPILQVATACFSCSPPDLNFLDPYFIFMYTHYNHCHRATAHLHLNILLLLLLLLWGTNSNRSVSHSIQHDTMATCFSTTKPSLSLQTEHNMFGLCLVSWRVSTAETCRHPAA